MVFDLRPLSSLVSHIVDNRGRTCPTAATGIPLIATNCIKEDGLFPVFENIRYVDTQTHAHWFRGHPNARDIIFVNKGSPGRVCVVPDPVSFCIAQDMVALRANPKEVTWKYLFSVLRSPFVKDAIGRMHVGTMIPHFKKGDFDRLMIPVLPMSEQEAVGDFYFALSAKIELNRKMNRTLEKMAQAIFKSWFIDFDGHDPAHMVDSGLGPIPRGWDAGVLEDCLVLQRGFDLPTTERTPGNFPVFSAGGATGTHSEPRVKGPGVVTGRSGKLGDVYLVSQDFWPLNTTLWIKEYRRSSPYHAFHLLQTLGLDRFNAGSAVPTLNRNHVHGLPLPIPPAELVADYDAVAGPLFDRHRMNEAQSSTLAALRDALLPKLISGEIRVPEAEAAVDEASA
jgi:type I restriction enzyme S subunit